MTWKCKSNKPFLSQVAFGHSKLEQVARAGEMGDYNNIIIVMYDKPVVNSRLNQEN